MRVHRPAAGPWIVLDVRIGVELSEEFVECSHPRGEDEGLIAVVAGSPIAFAEGAGHGQLRHFLAVAEDAELRLAGEHFLAADQAGLTASKGHTVVPDDALARELRADLLRLFWRRHAAGRNRSM